MNQMYCLKKENSQSIPGSISLNQMLTLISSGFFSVFFFSYTMLTSTENMLRHLGFVLEYILGQAYALTKSNQVLQAKCDATVSSIMSIYLMMNLRQQTSEI